MIQRPHLTELLCLILLIPGACTTTTTSTATISQVDDFVGWIERLHVDSELASTRAQASLDALAALTAGGTAGTPQLYASFVASITAAETHCQVLHASIEAMRAAAGGVFARWSKGLLEFSSTAMRQHSQARLSAARERYRAILAVAEPTLTTYQLLNRSTRDIAIFLANDLNPAAVASIENNIDALTNLAIDLRTHCNKSVAAAQIYLQAALPAREIEQASRPTR